MAGVLLPKHFRTINALVMREYPNTNYRLSWLGCRAGAFEVGGAVLTFQERADVDRRGMGATKTVLGWWPRR